MSNSKSKREKILNIENFNLKNYTIINKDEVNSDNIEPLGEGGSGIVYLAEQSFTNTAKVKRAIKFFIFRDDLKDRLDAYISSDNFQDEIVNITLFNHENLIKVIDGGIYKSETKDLEIPYIITDYVDGKTLEELFEYEEELDKFFENKEKIIELFLQILKGVSYLHRRSFFHCDIAPKNIFLKLFDGEFHAIIGDLGVGKSITNKSKKYKITGTKEYMPKEVQDVKDSEVDKVKFEKLQPSWDIFSLKKTFKETIEKVFKIKYGAKTEFSWLNALMSILQKDFSSVETLIEVIEKIQPYHRKTAGLTELSESDSGTWKKLLPIKDVLLTYRMKKIFNHPVILRLKKVPQLLMGSEIFPGSNHTRYEHSLGTYENMRYILTQLLKKDKFIELFDKELLEFALVSSALSNITRFPYSFAIHEIKTIDNDKYKLINQKGLLEKLFNYKEENEYFKLALSDIINKYFNFYSLETIKNIIGGVDHNGFERDEIQFIYSLINSSIDVRVLDFLRRDPYHLGLNNGIQFDFESLVDFLDIFNNKVAITSRGVSYVEQVIATRYWMYKNIYWNEPNRAYTAILKQILYMLESEDFQKKLLDFMLFSTPSKMLDFFKENALSVDNNKVLDLINLINSKRPRIFKRLFVINKSEEESVLTGVCNKISKMNSKELDNLRVSLENELNDVFNFSKGKINILIDIPVEKNKKLGEDINVIKYDGSAVKLIDISGIVAGINNYFDSHLQWLRIYIHPEYKERKKKYEKDIQKRIKEFLIKKLG